MGGSTVVPSNPYGGFDPTSPASWADHVKNHDYVRNDYATIGYTTRSGIDNVTLSFDVPLQQLGWTAPAMAHVYSQNPYTGAWQIDSFPIGGYGFSQKSVQVGNVNKTNVIGEFYVAVTGIPAVPNMPPLTGWWGKLFNGIINVTNILSHPKGYRVTANGTSVNDVSPKCFVAGTPIQIPGGIYRDIESLVPGELVIAFNHSGVLLPARITRIFRGLTLEWFVLSCGLTVTPGHRFLNEHNEFERIDQIISRGGKIVLEDGSLQSVTAERVVYSDVTRHLYEEAEEIVYASIGGSALQPEISYGWRTYNFEVEEYHTYIAGGVRVHNDSLQDYLNLSAMMRNDAYVAVAFDNISERFGTAAAASAAYSNEPFASPTGYANHLNDMIDAYAEAVADKDLERAEAIQAGLANAYATGHVPAAEHAREALANNQNSSLRSELQARVNNYNLTEKQFFGAMATLDAISRGGWNGERLSVPDTLVDNIANGIDNALNSIGNAIGGALGAIADAIGGLVGGIADAISGAIGAIGDALGMSGGNPSPTDGSEPLLAVQRQDGKVNRAAPQVSQTNSNSMTQLDDGTIIYETSNATRKTFAIMKGKDVLELGELVIRADGTMEQEITSALPGNAGVQKTLAMYEEDGELRSQVVTVNGNVRSIYKQNKVGKITASDYDKKGMLYSQIITQKDGTGSIWKYDKNKKNEWVTKKTYHKKNGEATWALVTLDSGLIEAQSYLSDFVLPANVIELTLMEGAKNGTANAGANLVTGNDLDNSLYGVDGNDTLDGGRGSDHLYGEAGNDYLMGNKGNDLLSGDDGDDSLEGSSGDDSLRGGVGNDTLDGGDGYDDLAGGAGNDQLNGNSDRDFLDGQDGSDTLRGGDDLDELRGGSGNDHLIGGTGDDLLHGESDDDRLEGEDGRDELQGGEGNDTLLGGADRDWLNGGADSDILYGDGGDDRLIGADGDDHLLGGSDQDILEGGIGGDALEGGTGNDQLRGEAGDDVLSGEDGQDDLDGGDGHDSLLGGQGNDALLGGSGNDTLHGGVGNDALVGGDDNDVLYGNEDDDLLKGNEGTDLLYGEIGADYLSGGGGNDTLFGGDQDDQAYGDSGNDSLDGGSGSDKLWGGIGNDTLLGGIGHDVLTGDADHDSLNGGEGDDMLSGGLGNDTLDGGGGSDQLFGGEGNDILVGGPDVDYIDGGAGTDTIELTGNHSDYTIRFSTALGRFSIVDTRSNSPDGTDLADVELFRFGNGELLTVGQLNYMIQVDAEFAYNVENSDGSKSRIGWRPSAENPSQTEAYIQRRNIGGALMSETIFKPDGTRVARAWDVSDKGEGETWTSYTQIFDANAELVSQVYENDNRSFTLWQWDRANEDWHDRATTFNNKADYEQGLASRQFDTIDEGKLSVVDFIERQWDRTGEAWSTIVKELDQAKRTLIEDTRYDDGSRIIKGEDYIQDSHNYRDGVNAGQPAGQEWKSFEERRDASNNKTFESYLYHGATPEQERTIQRGWDFNGESWTSYELHLNYKLASTYKYTSFDNGTHTITTWDYSPKRAFVWQETAYRGPTKLWQRDQFEGKAYIYRDWTNTAWDEVETRYNSNGDYYYQHLIKGGQKIVHEWDLADEHTWEEKITTTINGVQSRVETVYAKYKTVETFDLTGKEEWTRHVEEWRGPNFGNKVEDKYYNGTELIKELAWDFSDKSWDHYEKRFNGEDVVYHKIINDNDTYTLERIDYQRQGWDTISVKGKIINNVEKAYWTETLYDDSLRVLEEKDLGSADWDTIITKSRDFKTQQKVFAIITSYDDPVVSGNKTYDELFQLIDHANVEEWYSLLLYAPKKGTGWGSGIYDGNVPVVITDVLTGWFNKARAWEGNVPIG